MPAELWFSGLYPFLKRSWAVSTVSCLLDVKPCWTLYSWRYFLFNSCRGLQVGNGLGRTPWLDDHDMPHMAASGHLCQSTLGFSGVYHAARMKAALSTLLFREFVVEMVSNVAFSRVNIHPFFTSKQHLWNFVSCLDTLFLRKSLISKSLK